MFYTVADRILYFATGLVGRFWAAIWGWFLRLTIAAKTFMVGAGLVALAWATAKLGINSLARDLAYAGWLVLSLLAVFLICRHILLRFTYRNPYR